MRHETLMAIRDGMVASLASMTPAELRALLAENHPSWYTSAVRSALAQNR